jgi:hypothetical protein
MADLGRPKLADALKGTPAEDAGENLEAGRPENMKDDGLADMKVGNAEANEGLQTRQERLVHIGRGHLAAGRRPEHDHK